ncbi:ankyrin repeat and SOCS box-containing 13 [Elysia marginata]|uniref:Ankyrin repeat and SOCS box-containing 13 n=1 Tax=Elysia marginata TaxID=1093978 RepID=A0AAV4HRA4_9GAST|nr:ankyrin repeat and SOCS box-containing 13 [Elysia marginata]
MFSKGDVTALEELQEEATATVYGGLDYIQCNPPIILLAASHGQVSVLKYLLDLQVDVDATDVCGMTALHEACKHGHQECIELLLPKSKDIDRRDIWGRTPLVKALVYRNLDAAKFLLEHGANPNAVDNYGMTPITTAVSYNLRNMLKLLVDYGADLNQISCHHHQCLGPPLYKAINTQNLNLVQELLHLGASTQPSQNNVVCYPPGTQGSADWQSLRFASFAPHFSYSHALQYENAVVMAMAELLKRGGQQLNPVSLDIFMAVLAAHGLPLGPAHEVLTRVLLASRGVDSSRNVPVRRALEQQSPFLSSDTVSLLLFKLYVCSGSCQDPESLEEITGGSNSSTATAAGQRQGAGQTAAASSSGEARRREGKLGLQKRKVVSLHTQSRRSVRKFMMASGRNVLWATKRLTCPPALKTLLLLKDIDRAYPSKPLF